MFRRFHEKSSVNTSAAVELRKTALHSIHRHLGAKMVNFDGWDMPVEYPSSGGLMAEHRAVRGSVGGFVNISERRHYEQELQAVNHRLQRAELPVDAARRLAMVRALLDVCGRRSLVTIETLSQAWEASTFRLDDYTIDAIFGKELKASPGKTRACIGGPKIRERLSAPFDVIDSAFSIDHKRNTRRLSKLAAVNSVALGYRRIRVG